MYIHAMAVFAMVLINELKWGLLYVSYEERVVLACALLIHTQPWTQLILTPGMFRRWSGHAHMQLGLVKIVWGWSFGVREFAVFLRLLHVFLTCNGIDHSIPFFSGFFAMKPCCPKNFDLGIPNRKSKPFC